MVRLLPLCALVVSGSFLLGCGTPPPEPATAKAPASAPAAPGKVEATPAPTVSLADQVVLTVVVANPDAALGQGVAYVLPHLPPALHPLVQVGTLKSQLFKAMNAPGLESTVDTARPLAFALIDPEAHPQKSGLGPVLLAVPVKDGGRFVDELGRVAGKHESTPWGDHVFSFEGTEVRIRIGESYALLASSETMIAGAPAVLLPLVRAPQLASTEGKLRVDVATIVRRHGAKLDRAIEMARGKMERQGPQAAAMFSFAGRWLGYLKGIQEVTLGLNLGSARIRATATATATASGGFAEYLGRLSQGPVWGARFLPADAAISFLGRQKPEAARQDLDQGLELLGALAKGVVAEAALKQLRELALESLKHMAGESAAGMWVSADGGFGFGAAARVTDGKAAQETLRKLLALFAAELVKLPAKLPNEVRLGLDGFWAQLKLKPGAVAVGGARGDLVELDVRWPRPKDKDARKAYEEARQKLTRVLGPKPTLAYVSVGEALLIAGGKDYRKRLGQMAAIAKGGAGGGLEQTIQAELGSAPAVSFVYVPLATLAEQVMRLVERVATVPDEVKDMVQKILPPPGSQVPFTAHMHTNGPKLVLDLSLSPEAMGMIARGAAAAMGRMGGATP